VFKIAGCAASVVGGVSTTPPEVASGDGKTVGAMVAGVVESASSGAVGDSAIAARVGGGGGNGVGRDVDGTPAQPMSQRPQMRDRHGFILILSRIEVSISFSLGALAY
jgi:hypothetical protein